MIADLTGKEYEGSLPTGQVNPHIKPAVADQVTDTMTETYQTVPRCFHDTLEGLRRAATLGE